MPRFKSKRRMTLTRRVKKAMKEVAYSTQETKHHRVEDLTSISTSGVLIELNSVDSQGDGSGQFIGQEIRQVGIRIRGKLAQSDANNVVRVVVFTPTAAFQSNLDQGLSSPYNLFYLQTNWSAIREANAKRVYLDRNYVLNIASGQNDKIKLLNEWINLKMKKYKIVEGGNPPTGSDKVYLLLMSDSSLPNHPTFEYASTLYFKDA